MYVDPNWVFLYLSLWYDKLLTKLIESKFIESVLLISSESPFKK